MQRFPICIDDVVDLLHLERSPHGGGRESYQVKCPFCGDSKYHMNINTVKNTYNCFRCGGSHTGGGALDLYGRVALGKDLIPGRGGNGSFLYEKLTDALGVQRGPMPYVYGRYDYRRSDAVFPASDENLHRAYSALLNIEGLSLTDAHRKKLIARGLDEASIEKNGYRSVRSNFNWGKKYPEDVEEYRQLGIGQAVMEYKPLSKVPRDVLIGGYVAARVLERQGISMERVPGFFQVKERWMFHFEVGMLIPTRNRNGLIVGLQARKDQGWLRYMTISSKHLPCGVTDRISRAHFPLANAPLSKDSKILITEGPLKADVSVHLLSERNVLIAAIPGVNQIKILDEIFRAARDAGVTKIYNCFDMDKVTNPHVAEASRKLRKMAEGYNLSLHVGVWDGEYAKIKWFELFGLCRSHGIRTRAMPESTADLIVEVGRMAQSLYERGIRHSHYFARNGIVKKYWAEETKGIDDYLLREKMRGA